MTISIELARGVYDRVVSISHECIYQAVYSTGSGLVAGCTWGCISSVVAANTEVEAQWWQHIRWDRST